MFAYTMGIEGIQNMPPQNMPKLWHKEYFELEATENQQMQKEFSTLLPLPT